MSNQSKKQIALNEKIRSKEIELRQQSKRMLKADYIGGSIRFLPVFAFILFIVTMTASNAGLISGNEVIIKLSVALIILVCAILSGSVYFISNHAEHKVGQLAREIVKLREKHSTKKN